ncbi:MAG: enoyl-CoA hydratase-related protein, partial [Sphingomonadales bacterium]
IHDHTRTAADDDTVRAIILMCGGRTFFAGADIRELGKPIKPPLLRDIMVVIEASSKPVIAAMHGSALGGGFELALACHYRVALPSTSVGLPEAALGLLPGAGGTQRVPRLAGVAAAIDMIVRGRTFRAAEAQDTGLIDAVIEGNDLEAGAIAYARTLIADEAPLRRVRDLPTDLDADRIGALLMDFRARHPELFRNLKAPENILRAIEAAVTLPFDDGLAREAELCRGLAASPESAAQRHIFFAERTAAKIPDDAFPESVGDEPIILSGDAEICTVVANQIQKAGQDVTLTGAPATWDRTPVGAVGLHVPAPEANDRVVEVVRTIQSPAPALAAVIRAIRKAGRIPVVAMGSHGLIVSRMIDAGRRAFRMAVAEGTDAHTLEAALQDLDFPTGLFSGMDHVSPSGKPSTPSPAPGTVMAAVSDEGKAILDAGIAWRASDIDVALVRAGVWPLHTGGPLYWAQNAPP